MFYRALIFVLLLTTWVFFSGLLDPFHLTLGVLSSAFITWISADFLFEDRSQGLAQRVRQGLRMIAYLPWLLWQIFLANLQILKLVFSPNLKAKLQPSMVKVTTPLKTDFEKFLLANSITLTPGTVTARISGDELYIHAITEEVAKGLDGQMDKRIAHIFEEKGEDSE